MPALLLIQEQIQGLKNAPIARFDGLGCYQNGSVKKAVAAPSAARQPRRRPATGKPQNIICGA